MQLASSWIPGGLISAEPPQALLTFFLFLSLFFFFFSFLLSFILSLSVLLWRTAPGASAVRMLGVETELQLLATVPAHAPATASQDPNLLCDLHPQLMATPDP